MTSEVVALVSSGVLSRCAVYLRGRRGWTQAQLAEAVGRSQQWVSGFENGRCEVSAGDAIAVLKALGAGIAVRAAEQPAGGSRANG